MMADLLGDIKGIGVRSAVGMTLPGNILIKQGKDQIFLPRAAFPMIFREPSTP